MEDQNGFDDLEPSTDTFTMINQLKAEMRANISDVLSQMNQVRVEMRGHKGDVVSQVNLLRAEMRALMSEMKVGMQNLADTRQENGDSDIARLRLENRDLKLENDYLRKVMQSASSSQMPDDYDSPMYAQMQMELANHCVSILDYDEDEEKNHQEKPAGIKSKKVKSDENERPKTGKRKRITDKGTAAHQNGFAAQNGMAKKKRKMKRKKKAKQPLQNGMVKEDKDIIVIGKSVQVPKDVYEEFCDATRTVYLRKLLETVFGKEVLATHTLTGRDGRPALEKEPVEDIIKHLIEKYRINLQLAKKCISELCFQARKKSELVE